MISFSSTLESARPKVKVPVRCCQTQGWLAWLPNRLRQLPALLGHQCAQSGDGAGWVEVWRRTLAREAADASFESFLSAR